jgi:ligand-binding sensor domain-containing protein
MILSLLLPLCLPLVAQQVGEWRSYPATYNTTKVAETGRQVFAVANGTLYSYGKEDGRVTVYSRQTGLNDTDIQWIGYNVSAKTLLVIYTNGNIDLMCEDGIYNLPYLKNTTAIRDKEIYDVYFHNENAYVAARFGIMVVRLGKKEIAETYRLDMAVYGVCIQGETVYAATETGLLKAAVNDNLADIHNWSTQDLPSDVRARNLRQLCEFEGKLCFRVDSSGVFYLEPGGAVNTLMRHTWLNGMKIIAGRLIAYTSSGLFVYESLGSYETVNPGVINDLSGLASDGTYWLASGEDGLTGIRKTADNRYETIVSGLNLDGPKRNLSAFLKFHDQKLWIAGGGRSKTVRYYNPGTLMNYRDGQWFNFDENAVSQSVGFTCLDYTAVAIDPDDESHFFVGTCGEGVLEYKENVFVQLYDQTNSALQSTVPGARYVRVQGFGYDRDKNLWMTNSEVNNGIVVRKADGTWLSLYYPGVANAYFVDQILITSKGYKWVNVPHSSSSPGILVFDDKGTLDNTSDDVFNYFSSFKGASGSAIDASAYYSMVEDLNHEVWIGTNKGPVICSVPNRAIENPDNLYCSQIVREDENGQRYYFLNGEEVHAIAVDGGNRKWIGTTSSGVFLVSPDGSETIHHFNTDNSPLYSNNILSIAINHRTGEVFFGTDKGLISYRGEAIEASGQYADVYAYPNPVRLAVDNQVIITGLVGDSNIKITDLSGNLIYQGKSAGGQMAWNCRNRSGNHVATGIYLVLASTSGAKESVVTKIAVVR